MFVAMVAPDAGIRVKLNSSAFASETVQSRKADIETVRPPDLCRRLRTATASCNGEKWLLFVTQCTPMTNVILSPTFVEHMYT